MMGGVLGGQDVIGPEHAEQLLAYFIGIAKHTMALGQVPDVIRHECHVNLQSCQGPCLMKRDVSAWAECASVYSDNATNPLPESFKSSGYVMRSVSSK